MNRPRAQTVLLQYKHLIFHAITAINTIARVEEPEPQRTTNAVTLAAPSPRVSGGGDGKQAGTRGEWKSLLEQEEEAYPENKQMKELTARRNKEMGRHTCVYTCMHACTLVAGCPSANLPHIVGPATKKGAGPACPRDRSQDAGLLQ